ncbi:hypothetical protein ACYZTX_28995 [Pseudomonas sp. MDT1-17]
MALIMGTYPLPPMAQQMAAYKRDYRAADRAHADACERLAGLVIEAVEGEGGVSCSP